MNEVMNHVVMFLVFIVKIIGKIITISISKIKNNTAIKKNCDENGIRDELLGSNPHSNGDIFSRLISVFFLIMEHAIIKIIEMDNAIIIENITL